MKRHQLAINSVSTGGDSLAQRIAAYAKAGFTRVEFCLPQVHAEIAAGKKVAELRRLLDDAGMQCIGGFHGALSCFQRDTNNWDQCAANAQLLAELGATTMVVGTDGPAQDMAAEDAIAEAAAGFAAFSERIADTGITVCIEFNWSPIIRSLKSAAAVVKAANGENVGVLFDPAHYHCTPSKLEDLDATTVATISHVHVDDMADKPGDLSHCNADRRLPGLGCLPLTEMFRRIEQHGYKGSYSIEMFDPELIAIDPAEAASHMYQSLEALIETTTGSST